jgi:hypothetical protein
MIEMLVEKVTEERVCLWCGTSISSMKPLARFCTDAHRVAAHRERRKGVGEQLAPTQPPLGQLHSTSHAEHDGWARVREQHLALEAKDAEIRSLHESVASLEHQLVHAASREITLSTDIEGLRRRLLADVESASSGNAESKATPEVTPTDGRAWIVGAASYVKDNFKIKRARFRTLAENDSELAEAAHILRSFLDPNNGR